jgi:hypothetical protein
MSGEDAREGVARPAITGTLQIEESDLVPPMIAMSSYYRNRVLYAIFLALGGASVALSFQHEAAMKALPVFVVFVAFVAAAFVVPRLTARRGVRGLAEAGDASVSYRFEQESVAIRFPFPGTTIAFAYQAVSWFREIETAFLLYTSRRRAMVVHKRAFSAEGVAEVRSLLQRHVRQKTVLGAKKLFLLWLALVILATVVWLLLRPR